VALVVDVRAQPGSRRHPHFGAAALAAALAPLGIGYVHVPALGGRRPRGLGAASPNGAWRNASFRNFADHMDTAEFARALDEVVAWAAARPAALVCAEAVPWRCHRSLIADALVARGLSVRDILSPTRADPHRLHPCARVDGLRLTYPPPPPGPLAGGPQCDSSSSGGRPVT
jgi:uncharacterized protein (DUF488 family)